MSDSLRPQELQHARPIYLSWTSRVYPNSCSLSRWCHPTISYSVVPISSCSQSFPASKSFQMSQHHIRWLKYWIFSFNISPFNEHQGLITFSVDWFDLLAVQGTLKNILIKINQKKKRENLLQYHNWKASIIRHLAFLQSDSHIHTWILEKL